MTVWLFIAALTLSSSLDNLGVGLSYGIRNIRIKPYSNLLIAVICFLFSMGGIHFGIWMANILPDILPILLGFFLLFVIGIRLVLLGMPRKGSLSTEKIELSGELQASPGTAIKPNLKSVLQDPTTADFDNSQDIGLLEAGILGIALSANALTNGIGAGLLGFSPLIISLLAAIGSFVTVWAGAVFGVKLNQVRIGKFTIGQFGTVISGSLLLLIAFSIFLH